MQLAKKNVSEPRSTDSIADHLFLTNHNAAESRHYFSSLSRRMRHRRPSELGRTLLFSPSSANSSLPFLVRLLAASWSDTVSLGYWLGNTVICRSRTAQSCQGYPLQTSHTVADVLQYKRRGNRPIWHGEILDREQPRQHCCEHPNQRQAWTVRMPRRRPSA